MKNPPRTTRRARRSGESPYARYHKREYLYSQVYRNWFRAQRKQNGRPVQEREAQTKGVPND